VDEKVAQTDQRLYLGGNYYDAPMVYVKEGSGNWTLYNIGRDYLGSVTHVATSAGVLVVEYSYDPWGRQRDPATLDIYEPGDEPDLFLGRGFTGHEHLDWCGLINMNARLYDPLYGRFLSPDPFVQTPDFSQNFNRYSYALNNPLKYIDPSGGFIVIDSFVIGLIGGGWKRAKQMAWNDIKIWGGLFNVDNNKSLGGKIWELVSRFTWQVEQTTIGFLIAHTINTIHLAGGVENVAYLHGATVISTHNRWTAMTVSSYIMGGKRLVANNGNDYFQHEYGHYIRSQRYGPLYLSKVGIPSLFSKNTKESPHHNNPAEQDANILAFNYFKKYYPSDFDISDVDDNYNGLWNMGLNPINGMQWNNYKSNAADNDDALSIFPMIITWYNLALNYFPYIGDIFDGLINTALYNQSY